MVFWCTCKQSLSHKFGGSVPRHATVNGCNLGYHEQLYGNWRRKSVVKPVLYVQFKSVKKDNVEHKRSTASPTEKETSSVINQLEWLYPLFRKAIPFFLGVLQVVLKIKLACKEFICEGQNTLFLFRRNGFVTTWAGFEKQNINPFQFCVEVLETRKQTILFGLREDRRLMVEFESLFLNCGPKFWSKTNAMVFAI